MQYKNVLKALNYGAFYDIISPTEYIPILRDTNNLLVLLFVSQAVSTRYQHAVGGDMHKLAATAVKQAKANPYKMTDGGGLYLLVRPQGIY